MTVKSGVSNRCSLGIRASYGSDITLSAKKNDWLSSENTEFHFLSILIIRIKNSGGV